MNSQVKEKLEENKNLKVDAENVEKDCQEIVRCIEVAHKETRIRIQENIDQTEVKITEANNQLLWINGQNDEIRRDQDAADMAVKELENEKRALEMHIHVLKEQNDYLSYELMKFVEVDERIKEQLNRKDRV